MEECPPGGTRTAVRGRSTSSRSDRTPAAGAAAAAARVAALAVLLGAVAVVESGSTLPAAAGGRGVSAIHPQRPRMRSAHRNTPATWSVPPSARRAIVVSSKPLLTTRDRAPAGSVRGGAAAAAPAAPAAPPSEPSGTAPAQDRAHTRHRRGGARRREATRNTHRRGSVSAAAAVTTSRGPWRGSSARRPSPARGMDIACGG